MGRKKKTERCVEWECRTNQRDVVSGNIEKTARCVELEGRAKQRDVVIGKGEQNREMC